MNSGRTTRTLKVLMLFAVAFTIVLTIGDECTSEWESVSSDGLTSMGLTKDGTLLGWGNNYYDQLDIGVKQENVPNPVVLKPGTKWSQIVYGVKPSGIRSDGTLWNLRNNSQIGNKHDWVMVATGMFHTLALKKDGSLWVWGNNYDGQLGTGDTKDELTPTRIQKGHKWVKVFAGISQSFAIREDGTLWAWGSNSNGILGDGTKEKRLSPVHIAPTIKLSEISCGVIHTLALDAVGRLYAWGNNDKGELGDGTQLEKLTPTRIGSSLWKSISASTDNSAGVTEDGALWSWGSSWDESIFASKKPKLSPVQIGKDFKWKQVVTGVGSYVGVTTDGHMIAWGGEHLPKAPKICGKGACIEGKCVSDESKGQSGSLRSFIKGVFGLRNLMQK